MTAIATWLCAAAAASVLVIALYMFISPVRANRTPLPASTLGAGPEEWPPAPIPEPEGEPVRFANPFDPSEVFEFPAGTTQAEARATVAELLEKRALERVAQKQR